VTATEKLSQPTLQFPVVVRRNRSVDRMQENRLNHWQKGLQRMAASRTQPLLRWHRPGSPTLTALNVLSKHHGVAANAELDEAATQ